MRKSRRERVGLAHSNAEEPTDNCLAYYEEHTRLIRDDKTGELHIEIGEIHLPRTATVGHVAHEALHACFAITRVASSIDMLITSKEYGEREEAMCYLLQNLVDCCHQTINRAEKLRSKNSKK